MDSEKNEKLNQLLKGEHMSLKAMGDVISVVDEPELKDQLTSLQQRHYENVTKLSSHLAKQGVTPKQDAGVVGVATSAAFRASNIRNDNPEKALEYLCEGVDRGIQMAQHVVDGELDRSSMGLVKSVLDNDRKTLKDLRKTLKKYQK